MPTRLVVVPLATKTRCLSTNSSLALVAKATSHEAEKIVGTNPQEGTEGPGLIIPDTIFPVARLELGFDIARQFTAIGGQFSHDLLV